LQIQEEIYGTCRKEKRNDMGDDLEEKGFRAENGLVTRHECAI
jgi:hypothetical protein